MKQVYVNIPFAVSERSRIVQAGEKIAGGIKVSFRALCKRLIIQGVERIEKGAKS